MKKQDKKINQLVVYQSKNGAIQLKADINQNTIWATLKQIADLFDIDKSGISRHIKNIYDTNELNRSATVAKIATVQKEGGREIVREIEYYNLDLILSVGYRANSKKATNFRRWATEILRKHITEGFTVNKAVIGKNFDLFMKAVDDVKALLPETTSFDAQSALELVKMFANTWFSLSAYDQEALPKAGATLKQVKFTAIELISAVNALKKELLSKKDANDNFAAERSREALAGIVGNIFQSFGGKDLYPSLEGKAAHLLYFVVKNHPFVDGNKRTGAFSFVWFLNKARLLDINKMSPIALTALTLLVAESDPKDKEKTIGLIMLLLKK